MAVTEIDSDQVVVTLAAGGGGSGRSRLLSVSCDGGTTTEHFTTSVVECDHSAHLARSKMQRAGFDLRSTSITPSPKLKASALKQRVLEQALPIV